MAERIGAALTAAAVSGDTPVKAEQGGGTPAEAAPGHGAPGEAARWSRWWLRLAALLALGSAATWWLPAAPLDWQPALAAAEPWRAWTAAFVHWSEMHLLANLAGTAVVALLGLAARAPARLALAWFAAWPLTQLGLLLRPELAHYGGLSGVLHGGVAAVALWLVVAGPRPRRWVGAALLVGLAAKLSGEQPWGDALRYGHGWDIAVAPLAHATGAIAGLLCAAAVLLWRPPATTRATTAALPTALAASPSATTPFAAGHTAAADGRKPELDAIAVALLLGCCAIWGLGQVAAKVALVEIPPLLQAAARSLGATALLLLWARARGLRLWQADGTAAGGLLAGTLFAAEFACIFIGLQFTSASRMAVFIYLAPFVVALGMPLIARSERLRLPQGLGLLLAFAGVVWAFAEGVVRPAAGPRQWLGDGLGIAAALLWGLTTLTLRGSKLSGALPEKTLLYQLAISGVALGTAALVRGEAWPAQLGGLVLASLLFQTVVVTFASYLVWFWLMRHYPATRISAFVLLTPVFGLLAGVLLLHEPLTLRLVLALAAVCVGLVLVNRPPKAAGLAPSTAGRGQV